MWIHILIFFVYCVLFILSKGFFSKSGQFLAGKFPEFLHIKAKPMAMCLIAIFVGNLLGCVVSFSAYIESTSVKDGYLVRGEKGSGMYEEELIVTDGVYKEKLKIEVDDVAYTEEEIEALLQQAVEMMDDRIRGENESLTCVQYPLHLETEIEETGIFIDWSTDAPMYLDWQGTIGENIPKDGIDVQLTAVLTLEEYTKLYQKTVTVFPEKVLDSEDFLRQVKREIEKEKALGHTIPENVSSENASLKNTSSEDIETDGLKKEEMYLYLPQELNGKKLLWHKPYAVDGWSVTGIGAVMGILLLLNENSKRKERLKRREEEMIRDYPLILNKMILYMRAGISSRMALRRIVTEYLDEKEEKARKNHYKQNKKPKLFLNKKDRNQDITRAAFEELSRMYFEMEQGIPEETAYERFGMRCGNMQYRTFSMLLIQNLKKGSSKFLTALEKECRDAFEERKRRALLDGEEAGTKLLIPMVIMLLIVLMIIIVPSFMAFSW